MRKTHLKLELTKLSERFGIDLTNQPFSRELVKRGGTHMLGECLEVIRENGFLGELVESLDEDGFWALFDKAIRYADHNPESWDGKKLLELVMKNPDPCDRLADEASQFIDDLVD